MRISDWSSDVCSSDLRSANAERIVGAKRDFYDRICSGARNPIAFDLLNKLTLLTSPLRRRSVVRPERQSQSIAEIDEIVEAIVRKDVPAAKASAAKHVSNSAQSALPAPEAAAKPAGRPRTARSKTG